MLCVWKTWPIYLRIFNYIDNIKWIKNANDQYGRKRYLNLMCVCVFVCIWIISSQLYRRMGWWLLTNDWMATTTTTTEFDSLQKSDWLTDCLADWRGERTLSIICIHRILIIPERDVIYHFRSRSHSFSLNVCSSARAFVFHYESNSSSFEMWD